MADAARPTRFRLAVVGLMAGTPATGVTGSRVGGGVWVARGRLRGANPLAGGHVTGRGGVAGHEGRAGHVLHDNEDALGVRTVHALEQHVKFSFFTDSPPKGGRWIEGGGMCSEYQLRRITTTPVFRGNPNYEAVVVVMPARTPCFRRWLV